MTWHIGAGVALWHVSIMAASLKAIMARGISILVKHESNGNGVCHGVCGNIGGGSVVA